MNIKEKDKTYIAATYARFPVEIVSGKGSLVQDETGKEYIDLTSGIGVTSFGVADEIWKQAVIDQISKVQHMSNLYYTEPCILLAEKLCQKSGMSKVFFSNSGAEANECAIKAARKYQAEHKGNDCFTIVTLKNSFHGRTLTTLAATGQEHYHELFQPLTPGFAYAEPGDIEDLKRIVKETNAAAVMIEIIQGEGGVMPLDVSYLQDLQNFVKEQDLLLVVDEVQTGNGRTGKMYAYQHYDLSPDIISTAKALGGGLPIGATLLSEKLKDVFAPGDHGSTYGGNPVSCAAALSVVNRIDDELLKEVVKKGEFLFETFKNAEGVEAVSGLGLMFGIKPLNHTASEVVNTCLENGVLCLTAKDKVRLLPALNIPEDVLKKAVQVILSALK